ncbi:MAG: hypothetical protein EXS11_05245 [Gemmataceae bacterium]|nr:hypothetical protein [Gemmataceae bacterium]
MKFQCSLFSKSVTQVLENLGSRLSNVKIAQLKSVWQEEWKRKLQQLKSEELRIPGVTIAVVGGTGAGKSTLLNALLGVRILPVSTSRACTAAISEVTYSGSEFAANIEFVSRAEWDREITHLLGDMADEGPIEGPTTSDGDGVAKAARNRIQTVYQISDEEIKQGMTIEALKEPAEIKVALDAGFIKIASPNAEDFRKELCKYLDSKQKFWPLVKSAKITGPFPGLKTNGVNLVDLPGLNDPNEAREHVTRKYIKNSRFVWIVFNIKRALTRDIQAIIQSDDFVRQIVMDGQDNALTFVGTHADEFDRETAIEEFSVAEEATDSEIARKRNLVVKSNICDQLHEFAESLAQKAGDLSRSEKLSARLQKSPVFTVSAKDFMFLEKISKNRSSIFVNSGETEIPALREHLATISAAYTEGAHKESLNKQFGDLIFEIKHRIKMEINNIDYSRELTGKKRKENRIALEQLCTFLKNDIKNLCEKFINDLKTNHEFLKERLKVAFDKGESELNGVTEKWNRIHVKTLTAIVRRKGRYDSPTSGHYNFSEELSKPVLDAILFSWVDFFGDKMSVSLDSGTEKFLNRASKFAGDTSCLFNRKGTETLSFSDDSESSKVVNERLIRSDVRKYKDEMVDQVEEVRSKLYDRIPKGIADNMRVAYGGVVNEEGTGMKGRILAHLSAHAKRISKSVFSDTRITINDGVQKLINFMDNKYQKMGDGVCNRLPGQINNFTQDDSQMDATSELISTELLEILHNLEQTNV